MTTKFLINASTLVILIATLAFGTRASAQGSPDTNADLDITIGYPENGQVYAPPATIQLYALATEENPGEVVQFFANSNLIATITNIPGSNTFSAIWTNVPVGNYGLTAVISNSDGDVATSLPVSFSVAEDTNPPVFTPFGTLASPTNGSAYAAPADVGLEETWSAWDPLGQGSVFSLILPAGH